MARVHVHNLAMSVDGYAAGVRQSLNDPIGVGGLALHAWVFETCAGRRMQGLDGGTTGVDNDFIAAGEDSIGATIMGRNMFGPVGGVVGRRPAVSPSRPRPHTP